ncbi:hypothetical protein K469DRAFT_627317 [Zopfia rhizophila CBS 207.26]|uniref:MYND-type domain-containing protein n=1 Tax=Zopfia rhizophila CBS 207.26 TaxID=1314779 RepID=A0A6A6EFM9_9PEZI|nr:hypothetical protein K469DRAFT_627317 [Zopfia rhizophila CBS 207.26]
MSAAEFTNSREDIERLLASKGPPTIFNPSKSLTTGCAVCDTKETLSRCGACKVVQYCGRDHQISDRSAHKSFCNRIKKAQVALDDEEQKLRAHPGDLMTPPNIFEEGVGHFWGIHKTRPYMRARFALVEAQLKINTPQAVESGLYHLIDMLRLCRGDNMGVRDLVPALFLRLGRDQEAYDFLKWWVTTGQESDYDWGDIDLGYLDVKDADVFESVDVFAKDCPSLSHLVAVTLLKIRLLIDLQALQRSHSVGEHAAQEILDNTREHCVSSIISGNRLILDRQDQTPYIKSLEKQVKQLYVAVKKHNKYFWPALLNPGDNLTARPNMYGFGDPSQMQLMLQYNYNSWAETSRAIETIEELSKK